MTNRIWLPGDRLYLKKEHFCPDCSARLQVVRVSHVVNRESPEYHKIYEELPRRQRRFMLGDVEVTRKVLRCPQCERQLTAAEMQLLEGLYVGDDTPARRIFKKIMLVAFGIAVLFLMLYAASHG